MNSKQAHKNFSLMHFAIDHPEEIQIVIRQMDHPPSAVTKTTTSSDPVFVITPNKIREARMLCLQRHDEMLD
jgi:hypothetical protein